LRPPEQKDVPFIASLMSEWEVAKNLSRAPHPYHEEDASEFIGRQEEGRIRGTDFAFAISRKGDGTFLGACGVHLRENGLELGYWLGKPYWKHGYATEAAGEVLAFTFRNLRADRVWAGWFHDNPASGHVLRKLGFRPDGADERNCLARGHSVYCNLVTMSREDWQRKAA
jgi:RimJ/RimL family protein N-acetyltransferase